MTTQPLARSRLSEGMPALELLEGLSRLYEFLLVTDTGGRIAWLSPGLAAVMGGAGSPVGRDARDLIPDLPGSEQGDGIRAGLREQGYVTNARVEVACKQGSALPLDISIFPLAMEEAGRTLFVAIARPVQRRTRGAPNGAARKGSGDSMLDDARDGALAVDAEGFVSYSNPAAERLLGRPAKDLVGAPIAALVLGARGLAKLLASIGGGEEYSDRILSLRRSDGGAVQVHASVRPLAGSRLRRGALLFLRDAGAQRRVDTELERKNQELEHCVQTLAHDLRSPLVALLGFSRLLRQDYGARLEETGAHFLDRIEQAGRTMESLIHDVLELSRIGRQREWRSLIDPRAVLLQIHAELKPRLDAGGIRLLLPEQPPLVYCDRTRLYQVFSNLIGNAIDHMGPCESPWVSVDVREDGHFHRLTVRDPGRGIPHEHHERIFDVFQSLGPRSDSRRGTGIGLAIVKKIAETHSGRVWVESEPGRGATFHVTLPRP